MGVGRGDKTSPVILEISSSIGNDLPVIEFLAIL